MEKELFDRLTLVRFNFDSTPVDHHKQYPFRSSDTFVYLGDIKQMPGHGVFVRLYDGHVFSGYHTDNFVEVPEEEA